MGSGEERMCDVFCEDLYIQPFMMLFFRICYTDSIGVQEDQYPPNIAVKVNQSYCHVPVSRHISDL